MPRRLLAGAAGVLAGGLSGLLGSFAHGATVARLPVGLAAALGLSLACFVAVGAAARRRAPVAVAGVSWVLVVLVLSLPRPEGDLVVPGTALGYAWLLLGLLAAAAAVCVPYGSVPTRARTGAPVPPAGPSPPAVSPPPTATPPGGR